MRKSIDNLDSLSDIYRAGGGRKRAEKKKAEGKINRNNNG